VHKNRLPAYGAGMAEAAAETVVEWAGLAQAAPVDVLSEMAVLTSRIIARTVFGVRLERGLAREVVEGFAEYQRRVESFNLGYLLGDDEGWPVWRGLRLRAATRRVQAVVDKVIGDQLAGRGDHTAMLELLEIRRRRSPDASIGRDALRDEAATIFMAGHETTAAALSWAWYMLAKAPWAEAAVHAEVEKVLGDRPPTLEDVPRLDYCRAVIEETLRLYPPVAILGRQAKAADRIGPEGRAVEVEPAALVIVSPWLLHRSPDLWERPHHFVPERFLGERPAAYSYIPFAVGPRICPGLNFGLSEAVLCLAAIAQRYRLRFAPGARVRPQCRLTLRPRGGLPMLVERR
jgi:cytochrome P450